MKILLRYTGLTPLLLLLLLAFDAASYANAFIIPEELPSILSLVYSNIPPIKKDEIKHKKIKRNNQPNILATMLVVIKRTISALVNQMETSDRQQAGDFLQHLGNGTDSRLGFGFRLGEHADFQVQLEIGPQQRTRPIGSSAGSSKRDVDTDDYQQYIRKKQNAGTLNNNSGKSWLEVWSKETRKKHHFNKDKHRDSVGGAPSGMPASPTINESAYNQLQQLYDMNKPIKEDTIGTIPAAELDAKLKQLHALRSDSIPFKPMPSESDANEVDAKQPAVEVPFRPMPSETMIGTMKVENGPEPRKNLRRRKTPSGNGRWEKDKISADLADVSLD